MALINCPECNKEISGSASQCPNCGFPISQGSSEKIIVQQKGEGCFLQTLNLGCLLILIFGGLIVLSLIFSSVFFNKQKLQDLQNKKIEQKK